MNAKLIFVIILALLLSGCKAEVKGYELKKMIEFCEDKKGIHEVGGSLFISTLLDEYVICNDGTRSRYDELK